MKTINWNQASELGLVERINREILHPLGLAMARDPATGSSDIILVADDGKFEYDESEPTTVMSDHYVMEKLKTLEFSHTPYTIKTGTEVE